MVLNERLPKQPVEAGGARRVRNEALAADHDFFRPAATHTLASPYSRGAVECGANGGRCGSLRSEDPSARPYMRRRGIGRTGAQSLDSQQCPGSSGVLRGRSSCALRTNMDGSRLAVARGEAMTKRHACLHFSVRRCLRSLRSFSRSPCSAPCLPRATGADTVLARSPRLSSSTTRRSVQLRPTSSQLGCCLATSSRLGPRLPIGATPTRSTPPVAKLFDAGDCPICVIRPSPPRITDRKSVV